MLKKDAREPYKENGVAQCFQGLRRFCFQTRDIICKFPQKINIDFNIFLNNSNRQYADVWSMKTTSPFALYKSPHAWHTQK